MARPESWGAHVSLSWVLLQLSAAVKLGEPVNAHGGSEHAWHFNDFRWWEGVPSAGRTFFSKYADWSVVQYAPQLLHMSNPVCQIGLCVAVGLSVAMYMAVLERKRRLEPRGDKLPGKSAPDTDTPKPDGDSWAAITHLYGELAELIKLWLTDAHAKWTARGIFALLLVHWAWREFSWAFMSSAYHADVTNKMTTLTEHKDVSSVYRAILIALAYDVLISMPTFSVATPVIDYYSRMRFRDFLTRKALDSYLGGTGHAYYHVKLSEGKTGIDNPDQRISEDASAISALFMSLFAAILSSVLGFSMWTTVIFQVGGMRVVELGIAFSILRTLIAWLGFGTSIVAARQSLLKDGAELRYGLTRIRDSAEEIALGDGNRREYGHVSRLYQAVVSATWNLTAVEVRYGIAVGLCDHFPGILLWVLLLPRVLSGEIGFGDAMRVHMGYEQVSKVFGFFVNNFGILTDLQANLQRLSALLEVCRGYDDPGLFQPTSFIQYREAPSRLALSLQDVVVCAEGLEVDSSIGGLSFACNSGQALLIMGPSGAGKTSLLRSLAGLWNRGSGYIERPGGASREYLHFLPSRCYLPIGSLGQLVCYPDAPQESQAAHAGQAEKAMKRALVRARLGYLVDRWGLRAENDWRVLLSSGEQQRLAFARLFWHLEGCQPDSYLAVLDEATAALDVETEAALYAELRQELLPGGALRGFVSVGHRPQLEDFHDSCLRLQAGELQCTEGQVREASGSWVAPSGKTLQWQLTRQAENA